MTFELRCYYTQILSNFTRLEDVCLFLRKLEETCSMMHFSNIPIDVIQMKLIPFMWKILLNYGCMTWLLILSLLGMTLLSCSKENIFLMPRLLS